MKIPVIIVHMNPAPYLEPILSTARKFNPKVVLIGNTIEPRLKEWADFTRIEPYACEAAYFQKIYRHLSTNPPGFELFCFQRWFVLRDYLESQNLDLCFCIDSDVLLYADINKEFTDSFNLGYEFTLAHGTIGCSSFFTRKGLAGFCKFVRETYENKGGARFQSLVNTFSEFQKRCQPGGVCDMTLLRLYAGRPEARIGEMCSIRNNSAYDHNINMSDGYEMEGPVKTIYARNGLPYGKSIASGRLIQFNSLHFQGSAKQYIQPIADRILQSGSGSREGLAEDGRRREDTV